MVKKYLVSFLVVFIFSFSVIGAYAQAETANPTAPEKILEGMFGGLATAVGATTAIGLKAKDIYDNNKQAIYDNAVKAYQGMSNAAKDSWAAAVARGRTGADMAAELWDGLQGVFDDIYGSKAHVVTPYTFTSDAVGNLIIDVPVEYDFIVDGEYGQMINDSNKSFHFSMVDYDKGYASVYFGNSYDSKSIINVGYKSYQELYKAVKNIKTVGALNSLLSSTVGTFAYNVTIKKSDGTIFDETENAIYDQALKRALETDIPRAKDAGLVIPQADITVSSTGQKVKYDPLTGLLTLPDGTIFTGDLNDLKIGIPSVDIAPNGDVVWTPGNTDVWTGTGEGAGTIDGTISGKLDGITGKLQGILEGLKNIPADIGALLTKLFVPVGSIAAFVDLTNTLKSRLVLPDFGWLVTDGIVCSQDGKDIKIEFDGKTTTFVDMSWLYNVRSFYMPIMRGFLWFLFGWYAYRKIIAITNKVDGIKE